MWAKHIPNIISIIRIFLVPPILYLIYQEQYIAALLLFFVAGASDGLDGYLAKKYNWVSHLGGMLDPIADKLLLVGCYGVLAWMGHIPWWLVVTIIARDVIIVIGSFSYYLLYGRYEMQPSYISKLNTFSQIVLVLFVMASLDLIDVPANVVEGCFYFVFLTTTLSGLDYFITWGVKAWRNRKNRF